MNITQLKFHYRKSKLSVSKGSTASCKIRPGERTPDISFRLMNSSADVSLFDLLKIGRPLVFFCIFDSAVTTEQANASEEKIKEFAVDVYFVCDEQTRMTGTSNILIDSNNDFRAKYCTGRLFTLVIRPDGYVGFFEENINCSGLVEYCNQFLGKQMKITT